LTDVNKRQADTNDRMALKPDRCAS